MREKINNGTKRTWLKLFMVIAMFFVLALSTMLVACGAKNITLYYTNAIGEERTITVKKGSTVAEIGSAESVTGYTFDGWFKDENLTVAFSSSEKLESSMRIYAKYSPKNYKVVYNSNNGKSESTTQDVAFKSEYTLPANTFNKDYSTFVGWSKNKNDKPGSQTLVQPGAKFTLTTEGETYYAIWGGDSINIEYNIDDILVNGEPVDPSKFTQTVEFDTTFTFPALEGIITKAGDTEAIYMLAGFVVNGELYQPGENVNVNSSMIESNKITISSSWINNINTIAIFNLNKPENDQKDIHVENIVTPDKEGDLFIYTLPTCENLYGHNFVGWKVNNEGETIVVDPLDPPTYTTSAHITVFYAVWEVQQRTIVLCDGDKQVGETIITTYGETVILAGAGDPIAPYDDADRYTFAGWKATGRNKVFSGEQIIKVDNTDEETKIFEKDSITLYAQYSRRTVEVTFSNNGGVGSIATRYLPTKASYTFSADEIAAMRASLANQYYTLAGFNTTGNIEDPYSFTVNVGTSNINLYAIWERNQITISFEDHTGAIIPESYQIDQGSNLTLAETMNGTTISKAGFELTGFTYNETNYELGHTFEKVTTDIVLMPSWIELYAINFRGTGEITSVYKTDGIKVDLENLTTGTKIIVPTYALPEKSYIGEGNSRKYFAGWSTDRNASEPSLFAGAFYNVSSYEVFYPVYMDASSIYLNYTLDTENNTAVVTYNGNQAGIGDGWILVYPNVFVTTIEGESEPRSFAVTTINNGDSINQPSAIPTSACHAIIPEGISRILNGSFINCKGLTELSLPTTLTEIYNKVFDNCTSLVNVQFPDTLRSIVYQAFNNCSSLQTLIFPAEITDIAGGAFEGCSGLESITVKPGGSLYRSLNNCLIRTDYAHALVLGCKNSIIPEDENVKYIGGSAFNGCTGLTSIVIPSNIEGIDWAAFLDCTNLEIVNFLDGSKLRYISSAAFQGSGIQSIVIPSQTTRIDDYAFAYCPNLTSIIIPTSMQTINYYAFSSCPNLSSVTFENPKYWSASGIPLLESDLSNTSTAATYLAQTFVSARWERKEPFEFILNSDGESYSVRATGFQLSGELQIPDNYNGIPVTVIAEGGFSNMYYISSVTIPESITTIGNYAFSNCSVTELAGLNGVISIGEGSFSNCQGLRNITFPDTLKSIEYQAFNNCYGLTSLIFPAGITDIAGGAFEGCSGLESITVKPGESIYYSENNCLIRIDSKTLVVGCKNSIIPENIQSIGGSAFNGCTGLTTITIPANIKVIDWAAFLGCTNLETVNFANNSELKLISSSAFRSCDNLTSIVIPSGVSRVGTSAFERCRKLEIVTFEDGTDLLDIDAYAFANCSKLNSIIIPERVMNIGEGSFVYIADSTTVTIASQKIANSLTDKFANGLLLFYASTVYIENELITSDSTYLTSNFTKQGTSDKYDMWIRNS